MEGLLRPLPTVLLSGKRTIVVDVASACNEQRFRRSHGVKFSCGQDGLFSRRRWLSTSAPAFWGIQLSSHPSFEGRAPKLIAPGWSTKTRSKQQLCIRAAYLDPDLHTVLELATDAELLDVSNILYGRSFLSPLLKSLAPGDGASGDHDGQPPKNQADRNALMIRLEARFLFLAADAKAVLSGRRPSYRNVLLQVRKKLQIPCPVDLSAEDMESEIFLHLIEQDSRAKGGRQPVAAPKTSLKVRKPSPVSGKTRRWRVGLPSIVKLRGKELLSTVLKGGGAVTVSALHRMVFKNLSGKLLLETARYQLAKEAVVKTGQVAAMLETRVAVLAARQGLIGVAQRYITIRSAMMILGPMLWGTLLADMLISAVGTDYARVVHAIYAFAQIRLVRAYSWDDAKQLS